MNPETWITLAVSVVIIPSIGWLVREVLAIRGKMIALEERMLAKDKDCDRHQKWAGEQQRAITRIDKNVARLCQNAGVRQEGD